MSASISKLNPVSRPRSAIRTLPTPKPRPRHPFEPLQINMEDFEKNEMAIIRPITGNTWYQWSDLLINLIPESVKRSESDKQKVIKLFESKINNDTLTGYKPKNLGMPLKVHIC